MKRPTLLLAMALALCARDAAAQVSLGTYGRFVPTASSVTPPAGYVNARVRLSDGHLVLRNSSGADYLDLGGATGVSVNSPLGGDGTAGNHLTCATCATAANGAAGDLLYATAAGPALTRLADVAVGSYLRSGGAGAAPLWSTLKLANAATQGDLLAATGTNAQGSIPDVAVGQVLKSQGVGVLPAYGALAESDVASLTTDLAAKAPLASPTFTGTVTLPTTTYADSTNVGDATHRGNLFGLTLASGASTLTLTSDVADGAGAVAFDHNASVGFAVNGATIARFRSGGVNLSIREQFGAFTELYSSGAILVGAALWPNPSDTVSLGTATQRWAIVNSLVDETVHQSLRQTAKPTCVTGAGAGGAGSACTINTDSADGLGVVNVTLGAAPAANATLVTVTFQTPFNVAPTCLITAADADALSIALPYTDAGTVNTMVLKVGSVAYVAGAPSFRWHCAESHSN